MIQHKRISRTSTSAFTIVELLIVIVVIAILAAITIVAYNGIQDRAKASAASQALSNALKKIKYWQVEQDSTLAPSSLAAAGISDTGGVSYQYTQDLAGTYCITATVGNKSYFVTGTNSTPVANGCAGHGVGGTPAITNLVTNPSFENGTTANWALNAAYTSFSVASATAPHGTRYLNVSRTAVGDSYASFTSSTVPPANSPYTISFWIWADSATTLDNTLLFRTANSGACCVNIATVSSQPVTTTPTKVVMSGNTSANPTSGLQMILRTSSTIGQNIHYDGFMITSGSSTYNYADGSSASWAWNGTANNATSTGPPL